LKEDILKLYYVHEMANSIKTRAPPAWCIKVNTWTEPCINLAETADPAEISTGLF
jgi:hypothetical protein